eukprot:m.45505 g.45505  ORF g.45505 m.45505 type:complete len:772 (+) comp10254_c0_seq1:135-2450(+)
MASKSNWVRVGNRWVKAATLEAFLPPKKPARKSDGEDRGIAVAMTIPERWKSAEARAVLREQKLAQLLPIPTHVQDYLELAKNGPVTDKQRASEMAEDIMPWLVDILKHAHLDKQLKQAARVLLSTHGFTANLIAIKQFRNLQNEMIKHLNTLGQPLLEMYHDYTLNEAINDTVLAKQFKIVENNGKGISSQTDLIPILNELDYNDYEAMNEHVALHIVLLIGLACNESFHSAVRECAEPYIDTQRGSYSVQAAKPKQFARALSKAVSVKDYRGRQRPRGSYNLDVVRILVAPQNVDFLLKFVHALSERFGGLVRIKNLYSASETERKSRYNLLSVLANVVFDLGITYGELVKDEKVQQLWATYRANPNGKEPQGRWERQCDKAIELLSSESMAHTPVRLCCEVQILLQRYVLVRHMMHEPYKVARAADPRRLHDDYFQKSTENEKQNPSTLCSAARAGDLEEVKRLVEQENADVNEVEMNATAELIPLYLAAQNNHCDLVAYLLRAKADVSKRIRFGDITTASFIIACSNGNVDVVSQLLQHNASVEVVENGTPPLARAAQNIHADIIRLLLANGADARSARPSDNCTALQMAGWKGNEECVTLLLDAKAAVNTRDKQGETPLLTTCQSTSTTCVQMLIDNGAKLNEVSDNNNTCVMFALENAHEDMALFLLNLQKQEKNNKMDLHSQNTENGDTCLHMAARQGYLQFISELDTLCQEEQSEENQMEKLLNIQNNAKRSALQVARDHKQRDAAKLLVLLSEKYKNQKKFE